MESIHRAQLGIYFALNDVLLDENADYKEEIACLEDAGELLTKRLLAADFNKETYDGIVTHPFEVCELGYELEAEPATNIALFSLWVDTATDLSTVVQKKIKDLVLKVLAETTEKRHMSYRFVSAKLYTEKLVSSWETVTL